VEELAGKSILITGASGFIGSRLMDRLKETGCTIYALSRSAHAADDHTHWLKADVCNLDELRAIFEKIRIDIVFHLASHVTGNGDLKHIESTLRNNLISAVNLLTLVTEFKCERLVSIGSMEEPEINSNDIPSSPYSAAKWAATGYSRMFFHLYNTPVVTATLYMVYGPDQKDATKLIPYVTTSLLQNMAPKLSSGKRHVDWIYVDDVVEGLIQIAITPGILGQVIDIGSGQTHTIRTLVDRLVGLIKPGVAPDFNALADRPLERMRIANVERTQSQINWKPRISLDEGLARTVDWYKANSKKSLK
jgi:UDP-glucose 4-epimerase